MLIRNKPPRKLGLDEPIRHESAHKRPRSRREFIASGLMTGPAVVVGSTLFSLFANPRKAFAALSGDIDALRTDCGIATQGAGRIPFIAFDLAGGANMAGSEVLIGGQGGQLDFLTTAGYAKLGLPGDQVPNAPNAASPTNNFIDTSFGAAWHSDGAMLRGMLEKASPATRALTNGAVIAARSENDTANNPHNPMYGLWKSGADGSLLTLIGSRTSDSGGNSMAPAAMIDLSVRPTKVDRASDVTGLVDTGQLGQLFPDPVDTVAVLESIARISGGTNVSTFNGKLGAVNMGTRDAAIKTAVRCGYVKSADLVDRFGDPSTLNPDIDPQIVGPAGIFTQAEYDGDAEFKKTAAVMKMVVNGFAGAGTITMGGYDYHGQGRSTGEVRNLRAGRCIGACLEYARRVGVPLMVYVFSDGSLNANGTVDNTVDGRGKFMWASDNQSTAASFFLVFNPGRRATLLDGAGGYPAARHQQIGFFTPDGSVATTSHPGANAVNLLVEVVILNYLALHGLQGQLATFLGSSGLPAGQLDQWTAFSPICNGVITSPV
ncbi:MAG: hypothetical protein ACT4O5_12975 [Gammaproteobacteria bacterium]